MFEHHPKAHVTQTARPAQRRGSVEVDDGNTEFLQLPPCFPPELLHGGQYTTKDTVGLQVSRTIFLLEPLTRAEASSTLAVSAHHSSEHPTKELSACVRH